MSGTTTILSILAGLEAIVRANVPAGTQVFRDRVDAESREETPSINLLVHEDPVESFSPDMDLHQVDIELRLAVRSDDPTPEVEQLHAAVHRPIVAFSAGYRSFFESVRLGACSFDRAEADATSLVKSVRYRFTYLIPMNTL